MYALRVKIEISEEEEEGMMKKEQESKSKNKSEKEDAGKDDIEPQKSDEDAATMEEVIEDKKYDGKPTEDETGLRNRFEKQKTALKEDLQRKDETKEKEEDISQNTVVSEVENTADVFIKPNNTSSLLSFILYASMALSIPVVFFYSTGFFIRFVLPFYFILSLVRK